MFGRLIEIEGVDPSYRQEAEGVIRDRIIPGLKEIDGSQASSSLSMRTTIAPGRSCSGRRRKARRRPSVSSRRYAKRPSAGWAGRSVLRISSRH